MGFDMWTTVRPYRSTPQWDSIVNRIPYLSACAHSLKCQYTGIVPSRGQCASGPAHCRRHRVCSAEHRCPSLPGSQELCAPTLPRQAWSGTRGGRRASLLLWSLASRLHTIQWQAGV